MNKVAIAVLVISAALFLGACGDDDSDSEAESTTASLSTAEKEELVAAADAARREFSSSGSQNDVDLTPLPANAIAPSEDPTAESGSGGNSTFTDETGALSVVAPSDSQTAQLTFEDGPGMVVVGGDPEQYFGETTELTVSGVTFVASTSLAERIGAAGSPTPALQLVDWLAEEIGFFDGACSQYEGAGVFDSDLSYAGASIYSGLRRDWADCGGTGRQITDVAVTPADGSFVAYVQITYLPSEQGVADEVLDSFLVIPEAL